jgi:8-oxo-dGTP diphosphatase
MSATVGKSNSANRQIIAVGVVLDQTGKKVLISRRHDHVHLGGYWEFPGGKLHPGEQVWNALVREMREELNVMVKRARPLIKINHNYDDQRICLDVWLVTEWSGKSQGREGQEFRWVDVTELGKHEFPVADKPIIMAINLPVIYGITPDLASYDRNFFNRFIQLLQAGLRLIQFRSKRLTKPAKFRVIKEMFELCNDYGCRLLMNGLVDADMIGYLHGVHLTSIELMQIGSRPLGTDYIIAASCHNEKELEHACRVGIDFAVLSPVKQTASHPGQATLGWDGFSRLAAASTIPVYALGGMRQSDIIKAQNSGGQGVAMISGLWEP